MKYLMLSLLVFPLASLSGQNNKATLFKGEQLRFHFGAGLAFLNGTNQLVDHMKLNGFGDQPFRNTSWSLFGSGNYPQKNGAQIYAYFAPEYAFNERHSFILAYARDNKLEVTGFDELGSGIFGATGHIVTFGIRADELSFRYRHTFQNGQLSLLGGPTIEFREITTESSRIETNQNRNKIKLGSTFGLEWRSERFFCFSFQYRFRPKVKFSEQSIIIESDGKLVDSVLPKLDFNPSYLRIGIAFIIPVEKSGFQWSKKN